MGGRKDILIRDPYSSSEEVSNYQGKKSPERIAKTAKPEDKKGSRSRNGSRKPRNGQGKH